MYNSKQFTKKYALSKIYPHKDKMDLMLVITNCASQNQTKESIKNRPHRGFD